MSFSTLDQRINPIQPSPTPWIQLAVEAAVKQCMVVALTRTVGKHYKARTDARTHAVERLRLSGPSMVGKKVRPIGDHSLNVV